MLSGRCILILAVGFSIAIIGMLSRGYMISVEKTSANGRSAAVVKRSSFELERRYWLRANEGKVPKWPFWGAAIGIPLGIGIFFYAILTN